MYNQHPYANVGTKSHPTRRQVRAQGRKSSRNGLNWRHAMDASRYQFPVVTTLAPR